MIDEITKHLRIFPNSEFPKTMTFTHPGTLEQTKYLVLSGSKIGRSTAFLAVELDGAENPDFMKEYGPTFFAGRAEVIIQVNEEE